MEAEPLFKSPSNTFLEATTTEQ